jgi:hypothetical protein
MESFSSFRNIYALWNVLQNSEENVPCIWNVKLQNQRIPSSLTLTSESDTLLSQLIHTT